MKAVKFFGKLSLVALIFFSLQGEVVQRYVDLFQGKLEHRTSIPKQTAKRQQLIKLQCYTQKFLSVALPYSSWYEFCSPVRTAAKIGYIIPDCELIKLADAKPPTLRGPPSINS